MRQMNRFFCYMFELIFYATPVVSRYRLPLTSFRFGKGVKTVPHCALDRFYIGTYTILPKTYGCRQNVEKSLPFFLISFKLQGGVLGKDSPLPLGW